MLTKIKALYHQYPRQYWLMITGIVISTAGGSMIWPFLLIYASGKLHLPLSTIATLISINAGTGLLASFLAGWVADKIGRKVVMVFSLIPSHKFSLIPNLVPLKWLHADEIFKPIVGGTYETCSDLLPAALAGRGWMRAQLQ